MTVRAGSLRGVLGNDEMIIVGTTNSIYHLKIFIASSGGFIEIITREDKVQIFICYNLTV